MARTGAMKHTHRYYRVDGVWHCSLPGCTHYMPLNIPLGVLGKKSICWSCGDEFILDETNMRNDRPECFECNSNVDDINAFLASKGVD